MNLRLRPPRMRKRSVALVAVGALLATGLTVVTSGIANAAVSCQVDYTLRSVWPTGFTADMTIRNTGDALNGWTLRFNFPGNQRVDQGWNGNFTQAAGSNQVTVTNASWNGTVPSGGTVSGVGFNASYSGTNVNPSNFSMNGVACGGANTAPTVTITSPTVNQRFTAPATIPITATAGDADGSVQRVEFYHDGLLLGSDTSAPYSFSWTGVPAQSTAYQIQAISYDNLGMPSATASVPVFVDSVSTTPQLQLSSTAVSVPEQSTATFTVRLSSAPPANVTVTTARTAGDTNLTVSGGGTLTFTPANFATPQPVTLAAADDTDTTNGTATFTVSSTGGIASTTLTATEADNDTPPAGAIQLSTTAVSVPERSSAAFTVRLSTAPSSNVTVTTARTAGDTNLTVSAGATLTFTPANFATPQPVTLAAADDADTTNGTATFTVSGTGGVTSATLTATEADNDPPPAPAIQVSSNAVTVPVGGTGTYTVRLSAAPAANVTVTSTRTGGDTGISVTGGASLTFTPANFATAQTVTLTGSSAAPNGTATITVAATGLTSVTVTATKQTTGTNPYNQRFLDHYAKLKNPANGYFSPDGVPYHSVETLVVEAPDHGHETTSEAFSYWIWLEAYYGRLTGNWTPFNTAWNVMERFIIPSHANQTTTNYNPNDPADYAAEADQPSLYPQQGGHLDSSVPVGQDPLYNELVSTYGNSDIYGMHWLLDVDNVYGYASCSPSGTTVSYINTYQRGPQESVWETVAHPSCETFAWGARQSGGYLPLFIDGTPAQQWRYTNAPDADGRAVQAAYWAYTWSNAAGQGSAVSGTLTKAAKMGDYLRYAMYDKYFKNPGCASPSCPAGTGKSSSAYLMAWYYAWGGAIGGGWSWRIGASHFHQAYQNPFAAWILSSAGPAALRPASPTAAADWGTSLTRQLDFYTWLQSAEGAFAGGATNSVGGAYAARNSSLPSFYGMQYDFQPVYHDPQSNEWFGFQAWSIERLAEYYYVTGDARTKALLDKWVAWAISETTVGTGGDFAIPSTMRWTGAPGGSWTTGTTSVNNANLHVSVIAHGQDVGVTANYARLLMFYAARSGNTAAKNTAKGLIDALWVHQTTRGVAVPETRADYNRFDDIWSSSNQQGLYIPSSFNGVMPNGDVIQAGKSFLDVRTFYRNDPNWAAVQSYLNGGSAPTFTFHRFWQQADIAMAMADWGTLFPNG